MLSVKILWFFTASFFCSFAQETDPLADSLSKNFQKASSFLYSNFDSTMLYLDATIDFAQRHELNDAIASASLWKLTSAGYFSRLDVLGDGVRQLDALIEKCKSLHDSLGVSESNILNFLSQKGNYYYKLGDFPRAKASFSEIIAIVQKKETPSEHELQTIDAAYKYLGTIQKKQGNYKEAVDLLNYSLQYWALYGKKGNSTIANKHLADAHLALNNFEKAREYYLKTIKIYKKKVEANEADRHKNALIASYSAYAEFFLAQNQADSAIYYLNQSLEQHGSDSPFEVETRRLLAKAYQQNKGTRTDILNTYARALAQGEKTFGKHHYKVADVNIAQGDFFYTQNEKEIALRYYHNAVLNLLPHFKDSSAYSLPSLKNLRTKKHLLSALKAKSQTLYNLSKDKQKNLLLENAFDHALLAIQVIDSLRLDFDSEDSRQYLMESSYPIFELSLAICYDLYALNKSPKFLEEAFRIAEKSKALILLDALKNAQAQSYAGISNNLLEKGRQIRFNINRLKGKYDKAKDKPEKQAQLKNEIFAQEQAYTRFTKQLEKDHPKYYQSKYDLSTISINEVQKSLLGNRSTALVAFFLGDKHLHRFLVKRGKTEWTRIDLDFPLKDWIAKVRNSITGDFKNPAESALAYTSSAAQLYDKLLGGMELPASLILIPDGVLGYLPFDALLTDAVPAAQARAYADHPYLLRKHTLSYSYSATLLKEMSANKAVTRQSFLGFAPSFLHFPALDSSRQVTQRIANQFKGDFWSGASASRQHFMKKANGYSIMHISSHAVANDSLLDACYLVCAEMADSSDFLLYNRDLYNLSLSTNLVVLGACETGSGQLQRGEGIISLARGFSYAGASSLLTTLWSVDEAKTAHLFDLFYAKLNNKETTDVALTQAKRDYLAAQSSHNNAHPKYWASLIPIGNMEAVNAASRNSWWWMLGLGALVFGLGYWVKNRSRTNEKQSTKLVDSAEY